MKVDEFLANRDPGDETEHVEATDPDFQHVTSLTPDGIAVLYSWEPKRLYRLGLADPNHPLEAQDIDWTEVPSVTTALDVLDKPALKWWGFRVGLLAIPELQMRGLWSDYASPEEMEALIVSEKLSPNHVTDRAQDRGTNVHKAFEGWSVDQGYRPNPELYEENEKGYVVGLTKFLDDLGVVEDIQAEIMVGSLEHGFAGRFDLRCVVPNDVEMNVRLYPKRKPKRGILPAGTYIMDLKTSKDCFSSHAIQVAAYELASIECGYGSSDHQAVVRVSADGGYEIRRSNAEAQDFLAVLTAYTAMQRKAWFS